jgi:aminotransferase
MHRLAERVHVIEKSKIEESLVVLERHPEIISLGAGEPDFPAPKNVVEFANKMLKKGFTHYSPLQGRHELREALTKKLKKENKIDVSPDEIVITCGSKEALLLSMLTVIDKGQNVIIPDPGYVAYRPIVQLIDGIPKHLHLREEDGFAIHPEQLKKLIDEKTRAIVINTPSNPTGTVLKKKILEEIADIAVDRNLIIICDEAYEKLIYDDAKHVSIASLNGMMKHVITTQTFSKSYAMCGFRVGYAVAAADVIKEMKEFKICTTLSPPTAYQLAAVEALKNSDKYVQKMRKEYNRRRKLIVRRLNEIQKTRCIKPEGAFYTFPNIKELEMNSKEVTDFFLKKAKVLVIPGTEFGEFGEGFVRLSYATAYEKIEKAMERIDQAIRKI